MRKLIAAILRRQALRLLKKTDATVIVVAGSIGKTSTTKAVAEVVGATRYVRQTLYNYNTDVGVPCSMFAAEIPASLKNPFVWLLLLLKNEKQLFRPSAIDVFVLELGTDSIGELAQYYWLQPKIAIVTGIAPEHMEHFETLEAVAKEELSVASYAETTVLNKRAVSEQYLSFLGGASYQDYDHAVLDAYGLSPDDLQVVGSHSVDAIAAALSVANMLDLDRSNSATAAKSIRPQPGRMQRLDGVKESVLIDDTYNASPLAVTAALDYIASQKAPQRIALLGNMNELGAHSRDEHIRIGAYCDPSALDLVVTLGEDANAYTAPAAQDNGCRVVIAGNAAEAAESIKKHLKSGALVLLKGSQNGVFAEETVKLLLKNPEDTKKLVRQSKQWLRKKRSQGAIA